MTKFLQVNGLDTIYSVIDIYCHADTNVRINSARPHMNTREPDSYEALLRETLPWIDERFSKDGRVVHERPFAAARIIVEHFIVEIEGDTKDEYLSKPWFAGIYEPIYKWYEARYGEALTRPRQEQTRGLVLYFGTPLLFRLPLVLNEPGLDGTTWLRFPKEVLGQEHPLDWIESPPPLAQMPAKRREALADSTRHIATLLRSINNDLNTADLEKSGPRALVGTVLRHFEKAAVDASAEDHGARSLAVWELQMASEKTMKAYLAQKEIAYPPTHDLRALQKLAFESADFGDAKSPMAAMPTERRVMAWRYSELPPPKPNEFFRIYGAALTLCRVYAGQMSRKYVFNNFAVQLKRPPWHG